MGKSLMQMLLYRGYPKSQMYHHNSDLYVFVTPVTTITVEDWCKQNGYDKDWFCSVFIDNITRQKMYDCAFQYIPYFNGGE